MDDRAQTLLDHTYLRPGIVSRAGAIGLAAVGIGAGALLACYGASFFFNTNNKRLDNLRAQVEKLVQRPDRSNEIIAKIDGLDRDASKLGNNISARFAALEESVEELKDRPVLADSDNVNTRLDSIEQALEELEHRPILSGRQEQHEQVASPKNVIEREVTVFHIVPHYNGVVDTGWVYPDGASADQRPKSQYCYWLSNNDFGGHSTKIELTNNDGVPLPNVGAGIPDPEGALKKCVWWTGPIN